MGVVQRVQPEGIGNLFTAGPRAVLQVRDYSLGVAFDLLDVLFAFFSEAEILGSPEFLSFFGSSQESVVS